MGRGVTSIFEEILLQIGVFDVQANQMRVTNVQRPYTAATGGRGPSRARVVSKLQGARQHAMSQPPAELEDEGPIINLI